MLTNTLPSNPSLTSVVQKDNEVSSQAPAQKRLKPSDTNASSVITHRRLPLVILRSDYLVLAKNNHCAAKLLAVLENWTNWFVRQGKFDRWVKLTSDSIIKHLLGEHNAKQIRAALKLLVSLKFIRQEKRRSHKHDQAYFYWLDISVTQEAINALEPPQEPETDEDNLKMDANLEVETLTLLDAAKSTTSNESNQPHRSGQIDHIDVAETTASLNRDLNKSLNNSSSYSEAREEELKIEENKEMEFNQDNASSRNISLLQPLATLKDKPKSVAQPKDPDWDKSSAVTVPENKNQSQFAEDAELLKWVVEVKIPSLNLDEPPRNPVRYAIGMLRQDGEVLKKEFAEVLDEIQFQASASALTEQVEARAVQWRQAGYALTVYQELSRMPAVLLDGVALAAVDFLNKPIEQIPVFPTAILSSTENMSKRWSRQNRLKTFILMNECPGIEFLIECWGDIPLQIQIRQAIKKCPHWGIFINDQNQLEQME